MIESSLFSFPARAPNRRFLSDIDKFCHRPCRTASVCQVSGSASGGPLIYFPNLSPKKSPSFQGTECRLRIDRYALHGGVFGCLLRAGRQHKHKKNQEAGSVFVIQVSHRMQKLARMIPTLKAIRALCGSYDVWTEEFLAAAEARTGFNHRQLQLAGFRRHSPRRDHSQDLAPATSRHRALSCLCVRRMIRPDRAQSCRRRSISNPDAKSRNH